MGFMNKRITKRQFLKLLAISGGIGGVAWLSNLYKMLEAYAGTLDRKINLPLVLNNNQKPLSTSTPTPSGTKTATATSTTTKTATPTATQGTPSGGGHKVVHVHAASATSWDFSTGWYGNYVNQNVVNNMVDEGVKQLTGQSSVATAWGTIISGYSSGKAIAIKVNFNNSQCDDTDNLIDALVQPVNGVIKGLKTIGVQEQDIWIYDAIRSISTRFKSGCLYPQVHFFDPGCGESATFSSNQPDAQITFGDSRLTARKVTDVIVNATYLINMPIIKDHGISGVTLGFKNHFGSINQIMRSGEDDLHYYIAPDDSSHYRSTYNPLLDIYQNPNIRNKTRLIIGDGLYGAFGGTTNNTPPTRWQTFGNHASNSLFFALDAVAIDCVMLDILDAEPGYHPQRPEAEDYLRLASQAGIGIFERGNPWSSGYSQINYQKFEL
jgi:hypothetical protein